MLQGMTELDLFLASFRGTSFAFVCLGLIIYGVRLIDREERIGIFYFLIGIAFVLMSLWA
jgi:hypothetical protein